MRQNILHVFLGSFVIYNKVFTRIWNFIVFMAKMVETKECYDGEIVYFKNNSKMSSIILALQRRNYMIWSNIGIVS